MTKTEQFYKDEANARPCVYCDVLAVCTNFYCFLYAAHVMGMHVPIGLIQDMNRARNK